MESNTIWSFPDRGNWATHDGKYRGNWSPYIVRNLLLRYSFYEDLVFEYEFSRKNYYGLIDAKIYGMNINEN